jgi:hypothetical protein
MSQMGHSRRRGDVRFPGIAEMNSRGKVAMGQQETRALQKKLALPLPPVREADVAFRWSCQRDVPKSRSIAVGSIGAIGWRAFFKVDR